MFSLCSLQGFCSVVEELGSTQCYPVFCPRCYLERKQANEQTNPKVQWISEMLHNTEVWKRRHHPARTWAHWLSSQASAMFPKLLFVIHAGLQMHENSRKQKEHVSFLSNLRKNVLYLALYSLQSLQNTLWSQSTSVPFLLHLRYRVSPIVLNMYFDL